MLGKGFILTPDQADALLQRDPRNQDILFPYLNGEDLNTRPDCTASRWVINFHDWPEERARTYPDAFAIIERDVKPERAKNNDQRRREIWWRFTRPAMDLYNAIADLDRILVVARVSKTALPVFVRTGQVVSETAVVFATDDFADLALLSSNFHYSWAIARGSSLKGDLRYTPSDIYETLPRPVSTAAAKNAGVILDKTRSMIMKSRGIGLTKLYNMVHDSSINDRDIATLRDVHVELDRAVSDAYKWGDFPLHHGFHNTDRGVRFTVAPFVRIEVLDRLLALNHAQNSSVGRLGASVDGEVADLRKATSERLPSGLEGALF
ncbi:type IIL restriction-modification enzyme MmeI [Actinokineospora sp. NPDC004072]